MLDKEQLERLDLAFNPRSVAILGATKEPDRVGYSILESVLRGGYEGRVVPIHPRHQEILGQKVFARLDDVDGPVDLAIVALNERASVEAMDECGQHDVKGAICVAGGYKEMGGEGEALQARLAEAAVRNRVMLVGPNTLGLINAQAGLNASFWPTELHRGGVFSLITQSGGVGQMIGFKAQDEGLVINKWVGVGNRAALDFDDFLQYLAQDPTTKVIAVFMEGTESARRFVQLAGEVVKRKPVVILKGGKAELSQLCAQTHTGSMAGSPKVYHDVFEQFGLIVVDSVDEMVSVSKALALAPLPRGNRVAILTPSAGPSILLVDLLDSLGCVLVPFASETMERLEGLFRDVPVVLKNPLDAAAVGYSGDLYAQLADIVLADVGVDLLIAVSIDHKNRRFPSGELIELSRKHGKPVVVYYISDVEHVHKHREACQAGGIPFYLSAEETAWGAAGLVRYARLRS